MNNHEENLAKKKGDNSPTVKPDLIATEIDIQKERDWMDFVHNLRKNLAAKYNANEDDTDLIGLGLDLEAVREAFGDIQNVKGKRILDIACGSNGSEFGDTPHAPWFCRSLKELGANVVGVDIGDLNGEEFEHHKLDLSVPGALDIFPDHSFDAINSVAFFDSPRLMMEHIRLSSTVIASDSGLINRTMKEIGSQIKRLLKEDGKLLNIKTAGGNDLKDDLGL